MGKKRGKQTLLGVGEAMTEAARAGVSAPPAWRSGRPYGTDTRPVAPNRMPCCSTESGIHKLLLIGEGGESRRGESGATPTRRSSTNRGVCKLLLLGEGGESRRGENGATPARRSSTDGGVRELLLLREGGERLAASLRNGRGNPGTVELDRNVRELRGRRRPSAMYGGNKFLRDWQGCLQGADPLDSWPRLGPWPCRLLGGLSPRTQLREPGPRRLWRTRRWVRTGDFERRIRSRRSRATVNRLPTSRQNQEASSVGWPASGAVRSANYGVQILCLSRLKGRGEQ
jgi:hypothetical protein